MRELGRRGGTRARAREIGVDDAWAASEIGRKRLVELSHDDDKPIAVAASKALYSIAAQKPPADPQASGERYFERALRGAHRTTLAWPPGLKSDRTFAARSRRSWAIPVRVTPSLPWFKDLVRRAQR